MNYYDFIEKKKHSNINSGIETSFLPEKMFDFQKHITEKLLHSGRAACFLDTGLGKTIIELTVAYNHVLHNNKNVLIITPLAVAFQFLKEAEKFGISDIEYSKNGKFTQKIVICNYERIHYFNPTDFDCVILDESSILKNFDGAIKNNLNIFFKKINYRYLFTATPSPNDYIELGTSSEILGYLGYTDMLTRFFKNNNNSIDSRHAGDKFYLKQHAVDNFWSWVSSWSISARKPSDLGFSDENYILPNLSEIKTVIKNLNPRTKNGQGVLFNLPAVNFFEIRQENRNTIEERCSMAFEKSKKHDVSVFWVNLNDEAKIIKSYDNNIVEIKGNMDLDTKEDILKNFSKGNIKKLITKTSITGFGLNWQHCNHTTYFPTYSYEQYYQAIRRFWRFGQKKDVIVDLILSDGQEKIIEVLINKKNNAEKMFENLISQTKTYTVKQKEFNQKINKPKFL
jgi:hypothetical protein